MPTTSADLAIPAPPRPAATARRPRRFSSRLVRRAAVEGGGNGGDELGDADADVLVRVERCARGYRLLSERHSDPERQLIDGDHGAAVAVARAQGGAILAAGRQTSRQNAERVRER